MDVRGSHGREGGLTEDREEVPETPGPGSLAGSPAPIPCAVGSHGRLLSRIRQAFQSHVASEGQPCAAQAGLTLGPC